MLTMSVDSHYRSIDSEVLLACSLAFDQTRMPEAPLISAKDADQIVVRWSNLEGGLEE